MGWRLRGAAGSGSRNLRKSGAQDPGAATNLEKDDSLTLEDRIRRASRAQAIMADPIMVEAQEHIESECWRLFKSLAPTDTEGMAQVKAVQYMHAKYLAFFRAAMDDGKIAKLELEALQKKGIRDRFRALVR